MRPWEDRRILALFRQRDTRGHASLTALEERYGALLRALAGRLLGRSLNAEECVSEHIRSRAWNAKPPTEPVYLFAYLPPSAATGIVRTWSGSRPPGAGRAVVGPDEELEQCIPDPASGSGRRTGPGAERGSGPLS